MKELRINLNSTRSFLVLLFLVQHPRFVFANFLFVFLGVGLTQTPTLTSKPFGLTQL